MLTTSEQAYYQSMIKESKEVLDSLNIPYSKNIIFRTFNRSHTWGLCTRITHSQFEIKVTECLIKQHDDISLKDTIIHELLHSTPDGMSHTGTWKKYAERVNSKYGYHIKRCTSIDEKGLDPKIIKFKYKVVCDKCGNVNYFQKQNKIVKLLIKNPHSCKCRLCKNSSFSVFDFADLKLN